MNIGTNITYTYLMKDQVLYKIGKSKNPESRLKQLQTGNPGIKLICYGRRYSEKKLHSMFKKYRIGGEWFDLPRKAVTWIEYNIGDKVHVLQKEVNKEKYRRAKIDYEGYVIDFGKFKGTPIQQMTSDKQIRYCKAIFMQEKSESYRAKIFEWWYYKIRKDKIDAL